MIQGISVENDEPIIREVSIGYPADLAGIKSGDRILEVENFSIDKWSEATTIIKENVDGDIQIKWIFIQEMCSILEQNNAAFDIKGHRDAPPGLRIWCGPTVEEDDLRALLPWLDWSFEIVRNDFFNLIRN